MPQMVFWSMCPNYSSNVRSLRQVAQHEVWVTPYSLNLIAVEQLKPLIRAVGVCPGVSIHWPRMPESYQPTPAAPWAGRRGREQSWTHGWVNMSIQRLRLSVHMHTLPKCFEKLYCSVSGTCRPGLRCWENNQMWITLAFVLPLVLRSDRQVTNEINRLPPNSQKSFRSLSPKFVGLCFKFPSCSTAVCNPAAVFSPEFALSLCQHIVGWFAPHWGNIYVVKSKPRKW